MNWLLVVGQLLAAVVGGAGFAAIVGAVAGRPKVRAEAADQLADSAVDWARAVKDDAHEARQEAHAARQEAVAARQQMQEVRNEAEALAAQLWRVRMAIMDPAMTIERLRAMVPAAPGGNGGPGAPLGRGSGNELV